MSKKGKNMECIELLFLVINLNLKDWKDEGPTNE
jgi:hypothetical protein